MASIAFVTTAFWPTAIAPTKLALCRSLLAVPSAPMDRNNHDDNNSGATDHEAPPCPCCGGRMKVIESFNEWLSRPCHVRKLDGL
jgi:transposase